MLENFVSMDYVLTFGGMVAMVIILTQFTKKLFDAMGPNRTKWVVYLYSFCLCVLAAIWNGKFSNGKEILETCTTYVINSVIIWFTAMKSFEIVTEKEV
jgi:nitrate/nitrite transporter NarK